MPSGRSTATAAGVLQHALWLAEHAMAEWQKRIELPGLGASKQRRDLDRKTCDPNAPTSVLAPDSRRYKTNL
jgi:hypothetical protein